MKKLILFIFLCGLGMGSACAGPYYGYYRPGYYPGYCYAAYRPCPGPYYYGGWGDGRGLGTAAAITSIVADGLNIVRSLVGAPYVVPAPVVAAPQVVVPQPVVVPQQQVVVPQQQVVVPQTTVVSQQQVVVPQQQVVVPQTVVVPQVTPVVVPARYYYPGATVIYR